MSEQPVDRLLPSGVEVSFADIESALSGHSSDETKRAAGMALTATIVVAGPPPRLVEAAKALGELTDVGVRTVLISYGDNPEPAVRVSRQTVSLEGLRPKYLNNAVAALRLSSLPTLVWWRGGNVDTLKGLAALSDRLVLDAEEPREVWASVDVLAELTAVSDLRWTRLTRWRALMCHFFDIADVRAAARVSAGCGLKGRISMPPGSSPAGWHRPSTGVKALRQTSVKNRGPGPLTSSYSAMTRRN